jgi:hypothetical protein
MFIDLPPPDPSLEISVASRGYSKGLAQTEGAQLLARGEVAFGRVSLGAYWKNITSSSADGEAGVQIGVRGPVAGFDLTGSVTYKHYTGIEAPTDEDTFEFVASASRRIGAVTPRVSATFSFDDLGGTRESLYLEGGLGYRVAPGATISANVGRRERSNGTDYTTFNAGISYQIVRQVTVEARYYDTAESALGDVYEGRAVGVVRVRF